MVDSTKRPKLVGTFIRQKREALGMSQRALGQLFTPAVTTQFISNLERGVTPLPLTHVPTLTKALNVTEAEIMALLEREYALKLSDRLGQADPNSPFAGGAFPNGAPGSGPANTPSLTIATLDYDFMRSLYDAYRSADQKTRQTFATVCESIFNIPSRKP